MKQYYKKFQFYVLLMFFWFILSGSFSYEVMINGSIFSILIIYFISDILFGLDDDILKLPPLWRFIWFGVIVLISIVKASIQHSLRLIKNESSYDVIHVQLDTNNTLILTLIANAITMTPGTITLDFDMGRLTVIGFIKDEKEKADVIKEILSYQKPFLYRRV